MGCSNDTDDGSSHEDNVEYSLWYVGVIMAIGASICTNMGVNLQKYSFLCEAKKPLKDKRGYFFQPKWVFGLFLVIFGSLGDFAALGFIPQTLAIPVGGFTIVANVFFAHYFLKEPFSKRDGIGTGLIVIGVMIVAAFASKANNCYTLSQLIELFDRQNFIIYATVVGSMCTILYLYLRKIRAISAKFGHGSEKYRHYAKSHSIICPALSGLFGAQSVLFAKSFAELLKSTIQGKNQFTTFGTYLIAILMVVCIFLQIHWLAQGLEFFDAVFIIPVFQCFFISISIVGGAIYFSEFALMDTLQLLMFFVGVAITLGGVLVLSQRQMNVLSGFQKWRSGVMCVIFIKRTQKCIGHPFKWTAQYAPPLPGSKINMIVPMGTKADIDSTVLASEPLDVPQLKKPLTKNAKVAAANTSYIAKEP
ncbi:hypothetical protein THRCLA_11587 [Thraustotheca clavata]|uniref:Magnesium transporter NIPA2 n=1 Tax=Thraustotheca clavata TaxID=74557 RepID=A0A1V9Y7B4_9STRA|nr:hypothetical protein THRCLA_11587 [Thraustotheca clavata]